MLSLILAYIVLGATMAMIAAAMGGRVNVAELVLVAMLGPVALLAVLAIAGATVRRSF